MATVVSYLLVSNAADVEELKDHPVIENSNFEVRRGSKAGDKSDSAQFESAIPLEEHGNLVSPCQSLSASYPEAHVVLCEVEKRFEQIERVCTTVFRDGEQVGRFDHGSVFNVGG